MADASDPVAALYESTGKLSSALTGGTIASETEAYNHLISSVSSTSDAVKQLAADTLPLYFHHFPAQSDAALSAYFDLIEDASAATRLRAIKGLENMAKNSPALVSRLADVLAQLLVNDDEHERVTVRSVFNALFALDSRACFSVVFAAIRDADNDKLKERGLEYLHSQLGKHWRKVSGKEASDEIQSEMAIGLKGVLAVEGLSEKDCRQLMSKLMSLRVVKSDPNVKSDIAAIIASQAKLDKEFEASSDEAVEAFVSGLRALSANKRNGVEAEPFITYFSSKVLPVFDQIPASKRAIVIRQIGNHVQALDAKQSRSLLEAVWTLSKSYLPATKTEASDLTADEASHAKFATVESLLYLTHILASTATTEAVRDVLGFFVATGQPSDTRADATKRDTLARLNQLSTTAQQWGGTAAKELEEEKKKVKEQKELTDDEKRTAGKRRAMLTSDVKIAGSIAELIKPLTAKTHTFVKDTKLSWRGGLDDKKKDGKGKDGKRKADGKQQQQQQQETQGQGGKKQKTGKDQAPGAGGDGTDRKRKKGGEAGTAGGQQGAGADGGSASRKGTRGRDGQADNGSQQQSQQQQDGRGKKRKSEGGNTQQPQQQQQQQQQQGGQQGSKKRKGNQPVTQQPMAGAQQPNPVVYQHMAAAMMHNPQMMQAMAMGMHMAAMQQQQVVQQPLTGNRRGGGQQQQPQQQRQQQGGKQGGGGGGGGGGANGQKRKGRA